MQGDPDAVARLHAEYRTLLARVEDLRRQRNEWADKIPTLPRGGDEQEAAKQAAKALKGELRELEAELRDVQEARQAAALALPNSTHPATPVGPESAAVRVSTFGTHPPPFHPDNNDTSPSLWAPRDHLELCTLHGGLVDFEGGARVAGPKFVVLRRDAALMEIGLVSWSLRELAARGFTPTLVPDVCRLDMVEACGFNPRGPESQTYVLDGESMALAGTAEIPLAGLAAGRVFRADELPHRVAGFSHAFRREAGAGGATSRGLYRLHQFSKVEMFVHCAPADADVELQALVDVQCELLSMLGLHGQVLEMPTEELGASAHRKLDVEVWMPGRGAYGEVCSASDCSDYQARRLNTQFVADEDGGGRQFVTTLNATALAIPRVILAVLETHQQQDGSVMLPGPLAETLGKEIIRAPQ